jgi:hypothetical protein
MRLSMRNLMRIIAMVQSVTLCLGPRKTPKAGHLIFFVSNGLIV